MPTLPTRDDLGPQPSLRSGRRIATFDTSAIGRAQARFGNKVANIGLQFLEDEKREREQLENTTAAVGLKRYEQNLKQAQTEKAENISETGAGFVEDMGKTQASLYREFIESIPDRLKQQMELRASVIDERVAFSSARIEREQGQKFALDAANEMKDDLLIQLDQNPGDFDAIRSLIVKGFEERGALLPETLRKEWLKALDRQLAFVRESAMIRDDPEYGDLYIDGGREAYYASVIQQESSGNPNAKTSQPGQTAGGLGGFTDGTWKMMQRLFPEEGFTDKFDPDQAQRALVLFTEMNANHLARAGFDDSPGNLYLAHHFGAGGAIQLLRSGPDEMVRDIVSPGIMKVNPHLRGKSVADLRVWAHKAATQKGGADFPPDLTFADIKKLRGQSIQQRDARKAALREYETAIRTDPVSYYQDGRGVGQLDYTDETSFIDRQEDFRRIIAEGAESGILIDKPLSRDEVAQISAMMNEGSTADVINALGNLQYLGPYRDMALAQVKEDDGRLGYVGEMVGTGEPDVIMHAGQVIDGLRMIKNNPDQAAAILDTGDTGGTLPIFNEHAGLALSAIDGPLAASAKDVADALYLQRKIHSGDMSWDQSEYERAITDALGGEVYNHNAQTIVLPTGVDEDMFDEFLMEMQPEDLKAFSATGAAPMFSNGNPAEPEWFDEEAQWIQIGRGTYGFTETMGNKLADENGEAYIMQLDQRKISGVIGRDFEPDSPMTSPIPGTSPSTEEPSGPQMPFRIPFLNRDKPRKSNTLPDEGESEADRAREEQRLMDNIPSMSLVDIQDFMQQNENWRDLPRPILELLRDTYRIRAGEDRNKQLDEAWRNVR